MQPQPDKPPTREELERIESSLHAQLASASAAYRRAKSEARELHQIARDLGLNQPDGNLALRNAVRREREALTRYAEILKVFNDFVLRYRLPRDLPGK